MGREDFLSIMAVLTSLRSDMSGLSSRQGKLEDPQQEKGDGGRVASPSSLKPIETSVGVGISADSMYVFHAV